MPPVLLHPGVYIEEIPSGVRTITGVATSITLFVGWAPRGPTDRALRLTSFADYERPTAGSIRARDLGYAVRHFYDNGGADAYILRIADTATARTAACDIGDLHIEASSPGAWANISASGSNVGPTTRRVSRSASSSPAPTTRCSRPSRTFR